MDSLAPITLGRGFLYNAALVKMITDRHRRISAIRLVCIVYVLSILSIAGCSSMTPIARQASHAVAKSLALTSLPATTQQLAVKPASPAPSRPVVSPLPALSRPRGLLRPNIIPSSGSSRVSQTGLASWYGPGLHGRLTANGEVYNQFAMTAAHKALPFGSRVRVANLKTGQSVEVRINDRGPYLRGHIIDLSYTAARRLGVHKSGVALVQIEVLPPTVSAKSS